MLTRFLFHEMNKQSQLLQIKSCWFIVCTEAKAIS